MTTAVATGQQRTNDNDSIDNDEDLSPTATLLRRIGGGTLLTGTGNGNDGASDNDDVEDVDDRGGWRIIIDWQRGRPNERCDGGQLRQDSNGLDGGE